MLGLLKGVKVVDLTSVVLGPYATQILGDLGADVIKIEPLTGDVFRAVRPGRSEEMGAGYLNLNRNKRSIAMDLRQPEARDALDRLISGADVVTHNMRAASAERLGIGFERLREINPGLVYCSTSGFGQSGPDADQPAYDDTIQARSGLAHLNANASGEPRFLTTIVADKVGGLHLALGILAGLVARARTGKGVCVEAPMFESMVSFLMVEQLSGRTFSPPLGGMGYDRLSSPNRKPHQTSDGFISIIPYSTEHWVAFLRLIGQDGLCTDPRVTDPVRRSQSIDMLYALIAEATPERTTAEWLDLLGERDIPCAPVSTLDQVLEDDHLNAVSMFRAVDHPTEGALRAVRTPFREIGVAERPDRPAPRLGSDSRSVLSEAGLMKAEIDALIEGGALRTTEVTEGEEGTGQ